LELSRFQQGEACHVKAYLDHVVALLPLAPPHWKTFTNYFRVIAQIAGAAPSYAHYLLQQNTVAKLIDFFLGDDSPHPEVGSIPVNASGRRVEIGSKWVHPDWKYWLLTLQHLILCCNTGSASAPPSLTPSVEHPEGFTLPHVDSELLYSKVFLERFIPEASSRSRGAAVCSVIQHIVFEQKDLSQRVISYITLAIDGLPYDKMRPYFRVLLALVLLEDSLTDQRIDWILSSLLTSMEGQSMYWRATDFCVEHLIRLAKKQAKCYTWLHDHPTRFEWMLTWLYMHQKPVYHNASGMRLHKPNREVNQWGGNNSYLVSHEGLTPLAKKEFLDACKEGKEAILQGENDGDDSDLDLPDRVLSLNERVDVQDGSFWRIGEIIAVKGERVHVHMEGFGPEYNEWMDMSSPRIMPLGFHTDRLPPKIDYSSTTGSTVSTVTPGVSYAAVASGGGGATYGPVAPGAGPIVTGVTPIDLTLDVDDDADNDMPELSIMD
jgi:hypothetical protein